jgi:hypothetical protein
MVALAALAIFSPRREWRASRRVAALSERVCLLRTPVEEKTMIYE